MVRPFWGSLPDAIVWPNAPTPLRIETEIRIPALKDFPTELFGGEDWFAWIAHHLAAAVTHATDDANKLRMGIAGILLNLMHDPQRCSRIRLFGGEHESDPLAGHPLDDTGRLRMRSRVVAESPVKKRLRLSGQAIPINRRTKDDSSRRQKIVEEQRAKAIVDGALPIGASASSAVPEEARKVVVDKTQRRSRSGLLGAALNRRTEGGRVACSAGTTDKNKEVLRVAHSEMLCFVK